MRKRKRHSFFTTLLILGIGLPGLVGILAVQAKAVEGQANLIQVALQNVFTSTPTSTLTGTPPPLVTSTGSPIPALPANLTSVVLYAFIQTPSGHVQRPYVILTAFASVARAGSVVIRGVVNTQQFVCSETPCAVYLEGNSRLIFRAYADTGETSDEVIATVNVSQDANGYLVNIDTVNQFTSFTDACSQIWGVRDEDNATWDSFVQFPFQLNTNKTLHTLATRLILNGIVDARDCPAGGLSLSLDWPTACGLEKATSKMIEWQNQYDGYIWLASKNDGIPPKVLKTLIEVESQFWPSNSRFYVDEVGLGQINQLGVDVLLRRDPSLYQQVCSTVLSDCSHPYLSLEPAQQALIRGAVVQSIDASCASCDNGLDLNKAKDSISLISKLLKANCQQVDDILSVPYKPDPDADAATATAVEATVAAGGTRPGTNYEDYWRFTLLSYHSGVNCFQQAVNNTRKDGLPVTWEYLADEIKCRGGRDYVNGFMDTLVSFDLHLYQPGNLENVLIAPTIVPTRTPVPSPTPYVSSAKVNVQAYIDRNANGVFDPGEGIDGMSVMMRTSENDELTLRTENGLVTFDMSGYRPGIRVTISLPGLYRSESFDLPQQGEVPVIFKFDQPALPTIIP